MHDLQNKIGQNKPMSKIQDSSRAVGDGFKYTHPHPLTSIATVFHLGTYFWPIIACYLKKFVEAIY